MRSCATNLNSEMSNKELSTLLEVIKSHNLQETHLEIGTAAGGTLCSILSLYCNTLKTKPPSFIVIDPLTYFPNQFEVIQENIKRHKIDRHDLDFIKSKSSAALKNFRELPSRLDFILIDGSHKMKHVTSDFRWAAFLNCGGILAIHDYSEKFQGVFRSTNKFLRKNPNYKVISHSQSLLILKKKEESKTAEVSSIDILMATVSGFGLQMMGSLRKRFLRSSGKPISL